MLTEVTSADDQLVIEVIREDGGVRVGVRGELDVATSGVLDRGIDHALAECRPLVVDLRETTFMASCGLTAIVRARRQADTFGGVTVVVDRPIQRRMLEITGVDQLVNVEDHLQPDA